jgi:hypothetical protein
MGIMNKPASGILLIAVGAILHLPLAAQAGPKKASPGITQPLRAIELRIDAALYYGGLHAGSLRLHASLKGGNYQAKATTRSLGMANYLVNWRGTITAMGKVTDGILKPIYHTRNDKSRWGKRSVKMDYGNGNQAPSVVLKEKDDKNPYRKRDKVSPEQTINTFDHLSGLLSAILSAGLTGKPACGATIPFFDGKRRFNATLVPMGKDMLNRNRYSAFHGAALKCRLKVEQIAGFSHKWMKEKREARANGAKEEQVFVWVAPYKNSQIELPVKIEATNFLGVVLLHPTRIDIDKKTRIALKR